MKALRRVGIAVLLVLVAAALGWSTGSADTKERLTLTMFSTDSGVPVPQGIDPSDNWFIKLIEDYANVDLVLEIPVYQDVTTKLRLLLASRNLPDIVHGFGVADMDAAAKDGAFIDLEKYYNKSGLMQKWVTKDLANMARSPEGLLYGMPGINTQALGDPINALRGDVIDKYGKLPTTVDEYNEFLRWYHKNYPDQVPFTLRISATSIWFCGESAFLWWGLRPYDFTVRGGKLVRDFTLPEYVKPLELMNQWYKEGIFDQDFMSNSVVSNWVNKLYGKGVALWSYANWQIAFNGYTFNQNFPKFGGPATGAYYITAPKLTKFPAEVKDERYTYPYLEIPINHHRTCISAQSKYPDRAWKVLEAYVSDKVIDALIWGQEGIHHKVENGKKVPILNMIYKRDNNDPKSHSWVAHAQDPIWAVQFNDAMVDIQRLQMGKEWYDKILNSTMWPREAAKTRGTNINQFFPVIEGVTEKLSEANAFITQADLEMITGSITAAQFKAKQEEFQQKYGFITEAYDKWVQANKPLLRSKGVKEIDW